MNALADLLIRRAVADDAHVIADVLQRSFQEFRPLYTDGGFAATALDVEQVAERMVEGPVWIALRAKAAIGTVAAVIRDGKSAYIRGMAVLPEARSSGVAHRLLKQAEEWGRNEGCTRLFLSTTPFLHAAIRLYERSGYQKMEHGDDLFGTPLLVMEKQVTR